MLYVDQMIKKWAFLVLVFWTFMALITAPGLALAHPHVFINSKVTLFAEAGSIQKIGNEWTFDEIFTSDMVDNFDLNHDGKFEDNEVDNLRAGFSDDINKLRLANYIMVGDKEIHTQKITDFSARINDGKITISFNIPLPKPIPVTNDFSIAVYDETYFMEYLLDDQKPVTLKGLDQCSYEIYDDEKHPYYYGSVLPQRIRLKCHA